MAAQRLKPPAAREISKGMCPCSVDPACLACSPRSSPLPASAKSRRRGFARRRPRLLRQSRRSCDPVAGIAAMFDAEAAMPLPARASSSARRCCDRGVPRQPRLQGRARHLDPGPRRHLGRRHAGLHLRLPRRSAGAIPRRRERKYLAYWVQRPDGWRVVAYRQQVRARPARCRRTMLAPSLPAFTAEPNADAADHRQSNQEALPPPRRASPTVPRIVGLKAAFREYGRPDAMNMYGGAGFAFGLDASHRRISRKKDRPRSTGAPSAASSLPAATSASRSA